jgi:hypothetical protein
MIKTRKRNEFLFFAWRNIKLRIGLGVVVFFVILAIVGPMLTNYDPTDFVGPPGSPPSSQYWFGTTTFGEDVFTQFVRGLSSTFFVGIVGGGLGTLLGMIIGFSARFCRPCQVKWDGFGQDHIQGNCAEHGILPVHDFHPHVWWVNFDRRYAGFPRARPDARDFSWVDDEHGGFVERPHLGHVVVVHSSRDWNYSDCWGLLRDECWIG